MLQANDLRHLTEIDLLELGELPARCLKGENGSNGRRIVSGRAHRGLAAQRRRKLLGPSRNNWWTQKPAALKSVLEQELERLQRREKAYQLSLREVADQAEEERRRNLKRITELEQEIARLASSLQVVEKVAHRATRRTNA